MGCKMALFHGSFSVSLITGRSRSLGSLIHIRRKSVRAAIPADIEKGFEFIRNVWNCLLSSHIG